MADDFIAFHLLAGPCPRAIREMDAFSISRGKCILPVFSIPRSICCTTTAVLVRDEARRPS
jgi:hypothetical protein